MPNPVNKQKSTYVVVELQIFRWIHCSIVFIWTSSIFETHPFETGPRCHNIIVVSHRFKHFYWCSKIYPRYLSSIVDVYFIWSCAGSRWFNDVCWVTYSSVINVRRICWHFYNDKHFSTEISKWNQNKNITCEHKNAN